MANKLWDARREKLRELLKELRKNESGYTQVELSRVLGRPQSYVSKYEIGERKLDFVDVYEICTALDVSMEEFSRRYESEVRNST